MIIPDANLLLYAYDESSPFHERAKAWCEEVMSGPSPLSLLPAVVFGFVRIATHPRVFKDPLSVSEAADHVRSWLARRHVQLHEMLPEDVACALGLLEAAGTAGNLTTDAQIAAVALRLDAEVHTTDLDFGRFPKVRCLNPLR
ncbi:MAG: PIN domain-containing protein [Verrucomicrobiales bacterium]|nr:PIN domain-containing protein [Verrucomicrobiales bacterium]